MNFILSGLVSQSIEPPGYGAVSVTAPLPFGPR